MARIILPAVCAVLMFGCTGQSSAPQEKAEQTATSSAAAPRKGYELSEREMTLLKNAMDAEKQGIIRGSKTMLMAGVPQYSSLEIEQAYAQNRAAADQKFLKKSFIVRGDITGIFKSPGTLPSLRLSGSSPVTCPRAYISPHMMHILAGLKTGQGAAFACNGAGFSEGAAVLKDCMPLDSYAAEVTGRFSRKIIRFLNGGQVQQQDVPLSAVLIVALSRVLPDNATCFSGGGNCRGEIMAAATQEKLRRKAPAVIEELAGRGIKITQEAR